LLARIIIIASIIIAGGILLFPDDLNQLVEDASIVNTISDGINELQSGINNAQKDVSNSITSFENQISDIKDASAEMFSSSIIDNKSSSENELKFYGHVYDKNENDSTCKVSVPAMAETVNGKTELTHIITVNDCNFEIDDPVWIIQIPEDEIPQSEDETNNPIPTQSTTSPRVSVKPVPQAQVSVKPVPQAQVFEVLQLKTTKEKDDDIMIQYEDTSGQTLSVSVTLRNSESELFTGTFYSPKFETYVHDVPDQPHIIEMVVEHAVYGTITSSVYKPAGEYDTIINGVFTKS